jgi:hypothetical protein
MSKRFSNVRRGAAAVPRRTVDGEDGRPVRCPSEDDLYDRLDLSFIPPELRAVTRQSRRQNATHFRRSCSNGTCVATSTPIPTGAMAATV